MGRGVKISLLRKNVAIFRNYLNSSDLQCFLLTFFEERA